MVLDFVRMSEHSNRPNEKFVTVTKCPRSPRNSGACSVDRAHWINVHQRLDPLLTGTMGFFNPMATTTCSRQLTCLYGCWCWSLVAGWTRARQLDALGKVWHGFQVIRFLGFMVSGVGRLTALLGPWFSCCEWWG